MEEKEKCTHPGVLKMEGMTPIECWRCGKWVFQGKPKNS